MGAWTVEKPVIGIRQADGSFYEIMDDAQSGHKRLVLSAARTDQHGVRIELFRSADGQVDPEGALGSISIDDAQGLGYQDIEFRVDLDAEGILVASATLPGQPPQTLSVDLTRFRANEGSPVWSEGADESPADLDPPVMTLDLPDFEDDAEPVRRSDNDILEDESFALADLDTLDDSFTNELPEDEPAPRRSDNDILGDESFALADLDTLDEFSLDAADPAEPADADLNDLGPAASFDLGDLDAGFGDEPARAVGDGNPAEEWEKISLDDMEPMEFLDTGAEISSPSQASSSKKPKADDSDPFRIDDEPLELGDFDSDLSDLPDLGDMDDLGDSSPSFPASDLDDLDQDFLAPPALTESSPWDQEEVDELPPTSKNTGATKESKPAKAAKASSLGTNATGPRSGEGTIDKMALILSLAALSLLVLLILVLLFLNMIKAPQPPVIQPEVQRWKESSLVVAPASSVEALDLGASEPTLLEAQTILEIPSSLRTARVSLALEPGETVDDAARRFGEPARAQGNHLSW